ncbi:MAG: sodium:solute symporter [Gemmatimonadota bacterium]
MPALALLDVFVLLLYLGGVTTWGAWLGRGQRGAHDYFLGNRDLPWPAVALSIVATETSSLTFLSVPGVAYLGGVGFLQLAFGYLLGRLVVAAVLLPAYYRGQLVTAYQLLEERFGLATRRFTSAIFMLTRLLGDSVRLFATAIPLALLTGWRYAWSIAVLGLLTAVYTYAGGIRAVVWVDALQLGVYVLGAIAAAVALQASVPGGWEAVAERAAAAGKLVLVDASPVLDRPYTLWAGLIGGAFLSMASHGTDQLLVQRALTCRNLRASQTAMVSSGVAVIVQFALFLAIGLGLWAFYEGRVFTRPDEIFARFIIGEMPAGVRGLLVAAVFAAAMSSLSSSINALASASTYDFWAAARHSSEDDPRLLRAGRLFSLLWSGLLIGGAILFVPLSRDTAAVEVALGLASVAYGGLLGGFALAILAPSVRQAETIVAIGAGIAAVTALWALAGALVAWPWYVVVGTFVTVGIGLALAAVRRRDPS